MSETVQHRRGRPRARRGPGDVGDGVAVRAPGRPDETEGRLGVSLVTQPPGIATPLHRHTHEAEAFFVLEGG